MSRDQPAGANDDASAAALKRRMRQRLTALIFGEALIDIYPDRRVVAGAPLHVARHLAASGWHVEFITRLGNDDDGASVVARLAEDGVARTLVETDASLPTGRVLITADSAGAAAYAIARPAAWDAIHGPPALPPHAALYYGTLAARAPQSRAAWQRLLETSRAGWRVFDVNLRPPDVDPHILEAGLARATIAKCSATELGEVCALLGEEPDPLALFARYRRLRLLAVTHGASGAALFARDGRRWWEDAPAVQIGSPVGAGDAFTAALMDALVRGKDEAAALAAAVAYAADVLVRSAT